MPKEPSLYTRLPGRGLRRAFFAVAATRCRLYLAADHLLAVDATVASESYRRFYFRDIEAFVIRRTAGRQIGNWVLLLLALLTAGPLANVWRLDRSSGGSLVAALGIAAFWLVCIAINTFRGPTCQTHVRTAVQLEHLPSLGRLPVAQRVVGSVRPLIEAAQGAVTEEEYAAAPWIDAALVGSAAAPGVAAARPVPMPGGGMHLALFLLLLLDALFSGLATVSTHTAILSGAALATLVGFVVGIVAMVRQAGSAVSLGVKSVTFAALAYYLLGFATAFVLTVVFSIRHPGTPVVTGLEIAGEPGFATVSLVSAIVSAVLGLLGLAFWLAQGSGRRSSPGL